MQTEQELEAFGGRLRSALNEIEAVRQVPHHDQFFGLWAIHEQNFFGYWEAIKSLDLPRHLASEQAAMAAAGGGREYMIQDNVAIVSIVGAMMKHQSSFGNNTSTVAVRQQLRDASRNPDINSIILRIDSPGGTVAGTKELADEVAKAAAAKPVFAFIEDLGASAAYWVASQATSVHANATALVGSIGTYGVVQDMSGLAAREGVKVHVVRAGAFKGMGTPGTEVTGEHLQEMQRNVDTLNSFFLNAVAEGRRLPVAKVEAIADGRVHIASQAKELGLIDSVSTLQEVFDLAAKVKPSGKPSRSPSAEVAEPIGDFGSVDTGDNTMSTQVEGPKPASIAEIKAECIGATSDFILAQVENGATLEVAKSEWIKELSSRKPVEIIAEAKPEPVQTAMKQPKQTGVAAVQMAVESTFQGSAQDRWNELVQAKRNGGMNIERAMSAVNRENPGLRQQVIDEANAARRVRSA